jgi:hypothetical protein
LFLLALNRGRDGINMAKNPNPFGIAHATIVEQQQTRIKRILEAR